MSLSIKSKRYIIPEYNLTGDLLAFLTCALQYRYHNKGSLPPSTPVQLWFGEFIHSVMEEAYNKWKLGGKHLTFPWDWETEIREIELNIARRLRARGLNPNRRLFCQYTEDITSRGLCPNERHPHKLIASRRVEESINTWGPHLFPLVHEAEVQLKGIRPMPKFNNITSRSNYYGVTGRVDVISSINLQKTQPGNLILKYLEQDSKIRQIIQNLNTNEYEIIIDYKGMGRPSYDNHNWIHHVWQIFTYAWLRSQDPESKTIIAGILFYFNELEPSQTDLKEIKKTLDQKLTDISPVGEDLDKIRNWTQKSKVPRLSKSYRQDRSIRIIPIEQKGIEESLKSFDDVIDKIENCVLNEMGGINIRNSWTPNPDERNCTSCDFKTFCPNPNRRYYPTVP